MTDSPGPLSFGAALRDHLTRQGLSARAVSQRAGLTHGGVSRLLAGDRLPSLDTTRRLARALGLSLDQLCDRLPPV